MMLLVFLGTCASHRWHTARFCLAQPKLITNQSVTKPINHLVVEIFLALFLALTLPITIKLEFIHFDPKKNPACQPMGVGLDPPQLSYVPTGALVCAKLALGFIQRMSTPRLQLKVKRRLHQHSNPGSPLLPVRKDHGKFSMCLVFPLIWAKRVFLTGQCRIYQHVRQLGWCVCGGWRGGVRMRMAVFVVGCFGCRSSIPIKNQLPYVQTRRDSLDSNKKHYFDDTPAVERVNMLLSGLSHNDCGTDYAALRTKSPTGFSQYRSSNSSEKSIQFAYLELDITSLISTTTCARLSNMIPFRILKELYKGEGTREMKAFLHHGEVEGCLQGLIANLA
ncbi:putative signal peptide protein [Puccinia sorghi]|uniref:Putative signal peptide protein n=1 Tax=Puccinia sorghi TaxID=27349 RepID=A0A0L6VIP3_9BASI|nr:putative signal peptide protein [Puccinia sorghi]